MGARSDDSGSGSIRTGGVDVLQLHEVPAGGSTRRRFLKWSGAAALGAATIAGKLVGWVPSAEAATFACLPARAEATCLACRGTCQGFQSCCRANLTGTFCCCTCNAGPFQCSPKAFRAQNFCNRLSFRNSICCCTTC